MKREKKLTKKERKALSPGPAITPRKDGSMPGSDHHHHHHIHCTSCGTHLDESGFEAGTAQWVKCDHGSEFASCTGCLAKTKELLAEHDRTGQPVKSASAWH